MTAEKGSPCSLRRDGGLDVRIMRDAGADGGESGAGGGGSSERAGGGIAG